MRRLLWAASGVALGAAAALHVAKRLRAVQDAATPEGVARGVDKAVTGARSLWQEVRTAAAEREADLRAALLEEAPDGAPSTASRGAKASKAPRVHAPLRCPIDDDYDEDDLEFEF
ncbi:MAG: hypothetical protein LBR27_02460 [Bifidobacteriaceae bacterium]|jgi:hypothetical protein|nr:hypothetical protein [Bifidobacteriaceae bacterium]